jgi:hypothetical protein
LYTRLGKSQKSERILLLVEIIIKRSEQLQESYHSKADYYFRLNWNGCVFTTQRHTNSVIQIWNCHKRNLQASYILSSSFLHHHPLSCQVKVTMQRPAIVRGYDANSHDSRVSKLQGHPSDKQRLTWYPAARQNSATNKKRKKEKAKERHLRYNRSTQEKRKSLVETQ